MARARMGSSRQAREAGGGEQTAHERAAQGQGAGGGGRGSQPDRPPEPGEGGGGHGEGGGGGGGPSPSPSSAAPTAGEFPADSVGSFLSDDFLDWLWGAGEMDWPTMLDELLALEAGELGPVLAMLDLLRAQGLRIPLAPGYEAARNRAGAGAEAYSRVAAEAARRGGGQEQERHPAGHAAGEPAPDVGGEGHGQPARPRRGR